MESVYWKTLVEIARTGSISAAAAALGVSQSAVSRRVIFLEEQYEARLLDRSPAGVALTTEGRFVVERARAILDIEASLRSGLEQAMRCQRVRFGCTVGWGAQFLAPLLRRVTAVSGSRAEVAVEFDVPRNLARAVRDGSLHIAVISGGQADELPAHRRDPLPPTEFTLVSSPSLDLPEQLPDASILQRHTLLTRREGCCSRSLLDRNLAEAVPDHSELCLLVVDDFQLQINLASDGQGVAFLPRRLVAADIAAGRLREHDVAGFKTCAPRVLVSAPDLGHGSFVAAVREAVLDMFAPASGAADGAALAAADEPAWSCCA